MLTAHTNASKIEAATTSEWESIKAVGERAAVAGMALRFAVAQLNTAGRVQMRTKGGVIEICKG